MVRRWESKRELSHLATAAFGGVLAGALTLSFSGCNDQGSAPNAPMLNAASGEQDGMMKAAMHACAGLNGCKGEGAGGTNACAGQGGCATAAMHHECKGHNACKGQGGCGEMADQNACKGEGGCAVPMKDETAWKMAREKFETKMKAEKKEFGPAPAKG